MANQKAVLLVSGWIFSLLITPAIALKDSVGKDGVNALRLHQAPLNLLGRKIGIGQVEVGRPVKLGKDKAANILGTINPKAVFYRDRASTADQNVDEHATMLAC
ncbi:MAG: peptidase S8 and S53 subtilisin kexin sedolisin, partial [Cyanobacteria bacterium J06558_2]